MTISLKPDEITNGLLEQYESLAQLSESLDDAAWRAPTRCPGWEVRDLIGHVAGLAADAAAGKPFTRNPDEQAAAMREHTPGEIARQLRATSEIFSSFLTALDTEAWNGPSGVPDMTLATGVQALWFDAYVHEDDARAALAMPEARGPALKAAVAYLAHLLTVKGWGPATLALDGLPQHNIGPGGKRVIGDPYQFVLVAAGRADPATLGLDPSVNIHQAT